MKRQAKTRLRQKVSLIAFGVILSFVFLELALRFLGFALLSLREYGNMLSIRQEGAYRILCLGESTTQNQYPRFLEEVLNRETKGVRFSVIDKGKVGATTSYLLINTPAYLEAYHPNMVITMMGVNDLAELEQNDVPVPPRPAASVESLRVCKLARMLISRISRKDKKPQDAGLWMGGGRKLDAEVDLSTVELETDLKNEDIAKREIELKKNIELNPYDDKAYVALGWFYRHRGSFSQRESYFVKALQLNPYNSEAYSRLGHLYRDMHLPDKAEENFKKALMLNPDDYQTYIWLGEMYISRKHYVEAEEHFERLIRRGVRDFQVCLLLGQAYCSTGQFDLAEKYLQQALQLQPSSRVKFDVSRLYGALSVVYEQMKQPVLADEYANMADWQRLREYNRVTVENYRKLKQLLDKKKIKLLCAQYPMRDVRQLKNIFGDESAGIGFVDNQKSFREAVRAATFKKYFRDMFAGDFGHCTEAGNRLLAENIARAVLKEVFGK